MEEISGRLQQVIDRMAHTEEVKREYTLIGVGIGLVIGLALGVVAGMLLMEQREQNAIARRTNDKAGMMGL